MKKLLFPLILIAVVILIWVRWKAIKAKFNKKGPAEKISSINNANPVQEAQV